MTLADNDGKEAAETAHCSMDEQPAKRTSLLLHTFNLSCFMRAQVKSRAVYIYTYTVVYRPFP